jgi:hypothetical protein
MNNIVDFFRGFDWLANALGLLPIFAFLWFVFKWMVRICRPINIDSIVPKDFAITWSSSNAKSVAKIAIVDDQPKDFPIAELKSDGYNLTSYKQVNLADIKKLSSYDIIFLDMKGIVKDDPEYGGLKLIAELRGISPTQKICAVSSKTFDPTATEFFKQANNYKKKPLTAQECKSVIDTFIQQAFDVSTVLENARETINGMPYKRKVAVLTEISAALSRKDMLENLSVALEKIGANFEDVRVLGLLYRMISHGY